MRSSKPEIAKPKVPSRPSGSVIARGASKSGERTREHELRHREERYARECKNHGLDERRRLSEIERASKVAHEKTLRDRACKERDRGKDDRYDERRDERRSFEHRSEREVGQAGARKQRPMYSED